MTEFSSFQPQQQLVNRGQILKMALVYTPIALAGLVMCVVAIFKIVGGQGEFVITLVIFGFVGLLTGFQAAQYLKDLGAQPVEFEGEVVRKWHKGNLLFFLMPSFYITVDSTVLSGTVTRVEDNGAYVRMASGSEGFIPRKEIDFKVAKSARDMVNPGATVNYKVTGLRAGGGHRLSVCKAETGSTVGKIYMISRVEYSMLLELDLVKVTCYPHSATVERIERYDETEKRFIPATSGATV